jgi:cytochrome c oxidase assembly protein subunit 11
MTPDGNAGDGKVGATAVAPDGPAASKAPPRNAAGRRDIVVAAACGVFVAFMVGMAYAAVPFYTWFCRETGFGGVPQISSAGPGQVLDRKITVFFDANVGPGLPWRFQPERTSIDLRIGEVVTIFYTATNLSQHETGAQAVYNVSPGTVGSYFTKINCFCFTEQHLAPGETREMPVVFYVDPELVKDSDQDGLNTITLSYTFFPVRASSQKGGVADSAGPAGAERKKI